ncbi:MAG: flagellar assembly protein FliW [Clostridiales bacterium]|nr:flagellar assembly protein FliW [Clostridiales bacterium]
MLVQTARFGSIEIESDKIIYFKEGLPGFESLTKFVLLSPPELSPFHILQSIEDGDIALIVTDPFIFKDDYAPYISKSIFKELEIEDDSQAVLFTIIVIPNDYKKMTANLMAPIIINSEKRLGKQIILDKGDYPIRYPIFQNLDGKVG